MSTTNVYPTSARGPVEHDVRQQIVTAAKEHFSRYGYEKTTVSDLAKAIGFSKAYIYKFFASKQAIGEVICANCLGQIESEVRQALQGVQAPDDRLRVLFTVIVEAGLRLFLQDRRLYEIAVAAATDQWPSAKAYQDRIGQLPDESGALGTARFYRAAGHCGGRLFQARGRQHLRQRFTVDKQVVRLQYRAEQQRQQQRRTRGGRAKRHDTTLIAKNWRAC